MIVFYQDFTDGEAGVDLIWNHCDQYETINECMLKNKNWENEIYKIY